MTKYMLTYFDGLSNGELLTFKTGPPCIERVHSLMKKKIREN